MLYYIDEQGKILDVTGCNDLQVGHCQWSTGKWYSEIDVVLVSY